MRPVRQRRLRCGEACPAASGTTGCRPPTRRWNSFAWSGRKKKKIDITIDFIASNGDKLLPDDRGRVAGEIRPRHPAVPDLVCRAQADNLEPIDAVVNTLIADNGKASDAAEYLGKQNGNWVAVPGVWGNATFPCVGASIC